jgi:hypothetical protein
MTSGQGKNTMMEHDGRMFLWTFAREKKTVAFALCWLVNLLHVMSHAASSSKFRLGNT